MITKIHTSEYEHIKTMIFNNVEISSSYNHNYFYNKYNRDLILEEANDEQTCYYYRIKYVENEFFSTYLGMSEDPCGLGIFDANYEGIPFRNHNIVELNDKF